MSFPERMGSLALRVKDLAKVLNFYRDDLGFGILKRHQRVDGLETVELGFEGEEKSSHGKSVLVLVHDQKAQTPSVNSAGLFHFAILLPDRKSLASTYLALGNSGIYFDGFGDHVVSEALYLQDPEGNGIEIYSDRPKEEWKRDASNNVVMGTLPLNFDSLLSELSRDERKDPKPFPRGARIGHVHLKVTVLDRSQRFYQENLGLNLMAKMESAAFLSYDGYHHHVGMNTWQSLHGPPVGKGLTGLEYFTIKIKEPDLLQTIESRFPNSSGSNSEPNELAITDPDNILIRIAKS